MVSGERSSHYGAFRGAFVHGGSWGWMAAASRSIWVAASMGEIRGSAFCDGWYGWYCSMQAAVTPQRASGNRVQRGKSREEREAGRCRAGRCGTCGWGVQVGGAAPPEATLTMRVVLRATRASGCSRLCLLRRRVARAGCLVAVLNGGHCCGRREHYGWGKSGTGQSAWRVFCRVAC